MSDAGTQAQDPSIELVRAIAQAIEGPFDWAAWSVVVRLAGGRMSGTTAWIYGADGASAPAVCRPSRIIPALDAYLAWRYPAGEALPVQLLVQLDRTSGRFGIELEDHDANRWQVTPANIDDIAEELRPSLA